MKRPLGTAPGATRVDSAALGIENAVAVYGLHLHQAATPPPESLFDLLLRKAKGTDHPPLISLIKRNRRLPLTAESTAEAAENISNFRHQAYPMTSSKVAISMPNCIAAAFHFNSSGRSKMISSLAGRVNQPFSSSSCSSCPGPQPVYPSRKR